MVLCAGYGTRLGALTRDCPKPMLSVHGRPLLEYILGNLARHGFDEIVINLHFLQEAVHRYFGDGRQFGTTITYSHEPALLGTAGGVKKMEHFFRDAPFLIHYGDVVTDHDFTGMLRFHRETSALATLLIHQRDHSNSVISVDAQQRITTFLERPSLVEIAHGGRALPWVNSGVAIADPELLSLIPAGIPIDLACDIYPPLVSTGRLFGFPLDGYRCAVDSPQRLAELEAAIAEGELKVEWHA